MKEKMVYLEDSPIIIEQARLVGSFNINSVIFSNTFTDRAGKAIQILREEFGIHPKIFMPLSNNNKLTSAYLEEVSTHQANGIVLKIGIWGLNERYMDPGGFQCDFEQAVFQLEDWLSKYSEIINVPIILHPIRELSLHPQSYYDELLPALASFNIPMSLDLGMVQSDILNWNNEIAKDIKKSLQNKELSIELYWATALRNSEQATIPCACQLVDDKVWELWGELSEYKKSLLVMTDRLSSLEQFNTDLKKLINL
ncbi:hypothetical protein CN900_14455 [Bacillus anthracis]|uniref:hypothetical protein n=1 Tax=Bacillus sp. N35-10-4 TaxID=1866315 RepID=UPI0008FE2B1C|nr:hypothetical protein [Bacillus sp. N35-10-4]OJD55692.1 hypothetical protein BAU26_25880 [Bacillus sp. N35-10-4]PFM20620.1 hypothetical protein COJ44_06335 [Bacillus anthracis]PGH91971.1 hypothetical protein CN900_14455 [Bacillus anthracis]PGP22915.1 hypothetical protein CN994_14720 [Bacillus anthracis]